MNKSIISKMIFGTYKLATATNEMVVLT